MASAAFSGSTSNGGNSLTTAQVDPPSGLAVSQTCAGGSTITFRAATSAIGTDSLVLTTPAGTQAGDVLVAQVVNRYSPNSLVPPSGWTLVRRDTSRLTVSSAVFWRLATSAEPANATFTVSGSPGVQMAGGITAYSGVHTSDPVHTSGAITDNSPTVTALSVTTTVANTRLVFALAKRQEVVPAPSGTTSRWALMSGTGTANAGATVADQPFAGPGSTGARNTTASMFTQWVAQTVALRPIPGDPSAALTWTASPSSWATGYTLQRVVGGSVQSTATVTPIATMSTTDGPLVNGTTYTFRLSAYRGSWTSPAGTVALTPSC